MTLWGISLLPSNAISRDEYDIVKAQKLATAQAIKTANFDSEIAQYELEMALAAAKQFSPSGVAGGTLRNFCTDRR